MLPSVSVMIETKPCPPIENFGRTIDPPAAVTRCSSTLQSAHEKYTIEPPGPARVYSSLTSAPPAPWEVKSSPKPRICAVGSLGFEDN